MVECELLPLVSRRSIELFSRVSSSARWEVVVRSNAYLHTQYADYMIEPAMIEPKMIGPTMIEPALDVDSALK